MAELFSNPGAMTTEQLLAVCILGFILLAILVMIHRLLAIMKMSRNQTYKPNFRRLRRYRSINNDAGEQDGDPAESQADEEGESNSEVKPGNE